MLAAAPVCTLELGHISSGIRLSRRMDASRPSRTSPSSATSMSSTIRTPWPNRSAPQIGDRLLNRRQPERLARMNREAGVVVSHVLESIQMAGRRVAGLRAGDVEPDHALVPKPDRQLGDLPRHRGMPHRGDQTTHHDGTPGGGRRLLSVGESRQHGVDHRVERQAPVDVQLRGEPHLGVDHRVRGQVFHAFVGNAVQRLRRLHHRDGMRERFEVALQRAAVRRRSGTTAPACRRRSRAGRRTRCDRRCRARSPGADRRRGDRAAAPWAPS